MESNHIPKTRLDLVSWMIEHGIKFDNYAINGNPIYEGFGISKSGAFFFWYYTKRGKKENLKQFSAEHEVVAFAFHQITSDEWASRHCVGFSADADLIADLKRELEKMVITFYEDNIPFYGADRPVYRVFVYGCMIHKTAHLKEKYWTEK